MKKRKGEDVGDEEISPKKSKVSGFVEGKGNNKPGDLVRAVKGLLQKEQTRLSGLTKLLNALKESQNKEMIEGIIKEGGEFQEVFKILEGGRHNLSQLEIQKCLEILESILLFTADGMQLSSRVGMSIVQRVLQGHMKTLYTCLNPGNPPDVIKAALRLLTAMVTQGASAAREVQRSFDFTLKSLGSLTNKRDTKSAQDVRTCFIYFCLSFLMFGDLAVMKQILELRGFLQSIVKGLQFDSPNAVHAVLSTFQTRVVQNAGITKKTKVQFFNSYVLSQLATLYQYSKDAEEERPQTVRQQVHELLLKICGSFKFGICFSNTTGAFATRSNNPVLLRFLQSLSSVASDVLIQELVIKVLCCCQDVVSPFLSGLTATFEPRLSIPWVSSMNLVTKIYMTLPLPSHVLKKTSLKMSVDMLPSLMKMVIPAGISRAVLNRGVQHSSSLVKHLTLSLLVVILERAQNAAECLSCQSNSVVTLEHTNAQSETTLLQQFREEILKGLPDVKTVISMRQNLVGSNAKEDLQEDATSPTTLLAQSLKVILGFQTLWPSILSHINFDLKKLLPGQQQINFPPIVEHLTLQILLQAPAGSLKWHQQKGKNSTSFVYSVISLYTSARNENIKDKAKQLLWKLLSETGLVSNGTSEVDIWLTQLEQCEVNKGCKETLLWFLDEVFTAVSSEPHVYADIIVDMQGEVAALEARVAQSGMDLLEWNLTSGTSLPVSLLLLGALKRYTEMVGETSEPAKEATARNTGCVARYMNCVIFDMIHCSVNPIILGFTVCRYYGNTVIPKHLKGLRGVHQALLQYVSYWLPGEIQEKFRYFKEQARGNEKYLTKLYNFLGKTTVKTEKEKEMASAELYHHLELLDGVQLRTVICGCVEFCKSHLSGDFSPLVDVVKVKNHKFTGVTSTENIAPLLQVLPFSVFLWQVFGESLQDDETSPHEIQQDIALEKDVLSPILSAWIQDLLIRALEKEPISKTVSHCRHILLCLNALKTELFSVSNSLGQQRLQSAMLLCFQLLQYLVQRSVAVQQNVNETKSNILEVERAGLSSSTLSSSTAVLEPDFAAICRSVLHHPVLLNCFLWQPELASSQAICKDLSVQLSYSTCNLLLAVLPSLTLQQKHTLMGPFVKKLSHAGGTEIQSAQEGNVGSSYQVLYLLGLFHEYCDRKTREQLISTLSELPSNMLVSTDSASGNALPSAFLLTLLTLLKGASLSEDNLSQSSSALSRNAESNAKEPLTVAHFKQLIKISVDVNCPQLDATIMELLQRSLLYVQSSTTSLLDSCLDNPSEAKVAVAAHLLVHSPSLRSHFELRCLSRSNTLKMKAHAKTSPIQFDDHLKEFLPLVSSYLFCARGLDQDTSGENRAQAVISHLLQLCWEPLWEWLVGDREGTFKSSEEQCMKLLVAMIHIKKRDDGVEKTFRELLNKASLWDKFQFRICYQLLRRLCHECSADEEATGLTSAFSFACMDYLSIVLGRKGDKKDEDDVFEDSLAHLELICKESTPLSIYNDSCVSTWNIFVTNSLRYKYESANVLRALRYIIQTLYTEETSDKCVSSTLLPLDTLYEMVLSHSQFLEVILSDEEAGKKNLKEALTELMVAIVEKSPACCQSSHLPVLFAAYTASLSTADQSILYLLNLYEKNHTSFKNYRPTLWGPAAASHHQIAKSLGPSLWQQPSVTEVLEQLDASRMNQSAVSFPQNRRLQPQIQPEFSHEKPHGVYDPCFLLPLFSCLLAPNYQVDCRKFVEQGCLSFTVASLSSRDAHVRQAGYHVLTRFITHLEGARFKERKQIFHLLKCLKNGITEANVRISSVMVCFIARVAYILLKPEHAFYIMMNSYLLQRPALDLRDLPLFYSMFNSSTMQHATERSWMLHLLVDGMKDSPDYYLYKRRHVIELALSYHDSPVSDQRSQDLVTQLLLSALKIHPAAYDLAKNYGVIAWIHSLCFKSPESLCTSLNLLYTLWFTLYRGEVEKRVAVTRNEGGNDTHVQKAVRLPPNVAQECVLVCWTLLEQLRSQPLARDTPGFFELLAAVTSYLKANHQQSGLSRDRIVSLLHLWYAAFDETCALNQLLSSLSIDKGSSIDTQPCAHCNDSKMKTDSLYSLLSILTTWEPALSSETDESVLLVWRFGLSWRHKSSMDNTLGNCCRRGEESQIPISLLSLLRWFRKCLVRNRTLQNHLVTESPNVEIKVILQIYQAGLASAKTGLLEHWGHRGSQINVRFSVIRELNMICLILFVALQRSKHDNGLALPQPAVCQLMSQEPYAALITKGLQEVLLPLLPNPSSEFEDVSFQGQDVIVQELVSLFMQELWMERPSPDNFLSFLLSHTGCGLPVVDSLVLALGGIKVIASWTQNTNM